MGGNADLCGLMHLPRADLHLQHHALRTDNRGVKRLVHVAFGSGDKVFEAGDDRRIHGVDQAQNVVAFRYGIDQNTKRQKIVDFIKRSSTHVHFLVNAAEILRTARHFGLDPRFFEGIRKRTLHGFDAGLALFPREVDPFLDIPVRFRFQPLEAEVFQFRPNPGHAQPVGKRRIDIATLVNHAFLAFWTHIFQGAHVVEPVRQFDENHADVSGHGEQHLAEILGLFGFGAPEGKIADSGYAIHEAGNFRPEMRFDLGKRNTGIVDNVV